MFETPKMGTACPLCQKEAKFQAHDPLVVFCELCGHFQMSFELSYDRDMRWEPHPYLSAATRKAWGSGRALTLTMENWRDREEEQRSIRVSEKLTDLLRLIGERSGSPGQHWKINPNFDFPLIAAVDRAELESFLDYLEHRGFLRLLRDGDGIVCALTIPGWQEFEPMPAAGGLPGRCFIAMSFDPLLDDAYQAGIRPAVTECGFNPVCMKEIATNEGITDRIMSEIRLAQFVVADFTGQRGGVYFEAGFARGLGREVIWSCRKDEINLLHFDTKHLGHVVWETPADLRALLAQSIRANIIPKR